MSAVPAHSAPRVSEAASALPVPSVSFFEAFKFWLRLGFISFGGPAGQIALMHRELVDGSRKAAFCTP
jgi:chromate transporter